MPRLPRIDVPGVPQHLIVRGNNRGLMFRDDADRMIFLRFLQEALATGSCDLHAFVLMTNHVHLLATGHAPCALSWLMQDVGRKFARLMNQRWGRTGTLFEGRFKSSLVDSEGYLLTCMQYIELNPVRASIVRRPEDFPWSSHGQNVSGNPAAPLVPHEVYLRLADAPAERGRVYRELVDAGVREDDLARIRSSARTCRALGSDEFCTQMSSCLQRPVEPRSQGRPRKNGDRLKK